MSFQEPVGFGLVSRPRRRPGWIWFLLTLAVLVAGIVWLISGVASVASAINDLRRVPVPGQGTVSLTHSGGYTLYYEGPGARTGDIPRLHVLVEPASPGAAVASLTHYNTTVTYRAGSHQGRAALSLRLKSPGRFTVTTTGVARSGADFAIGGSIGSAIISALVPSIPLIIVGFGGSLTVLILRLVRRRPARLGFA
jgi:hypothetical protein